MTDVSVHPVGDQSRPDAQRVELLGVGRGHDHAPEDAERRAEREPGRLDERVVRLRDSRDQKPTKEPVGREHEQERAQSAGDGHPHAPSAVRKGDVLEQPDETVAPVHRDVRPRGDALVAVPPHPHAEEGEGATLLEVDHRSEAPRARPPEVVLREVHRRAVHRRRPAGPRGHRPRCEAAIVASVMASMIAITRTPAYNRASATNFD